MYTISFDFNRALQQAARLDELAAQLSSLSGNQFSGTLQQVSHNWKSDSASKYIQKGARLQGNMGKTVKDLQITANNIRITARRIHEAEMEAKRLADQRTSRG